MIKNIAVLGFSHPTALGILRCLRVLKKKGVKIGLIGGNENYGGAYYSNIPDKKLDMGCTSNIVDYLKEIRHNFDDDPALFLSTDQQAIEISERREEIAGMYNLLLPERELLNNLMEKSKFQNLAEQNGWPVPTSMSISTEDELKNADEHIKYPFVVKPYLVHSRKVQNSSDLKLLINELQPINYKSMVVQEWIEGNDTDLYFDLTISNRNYELIARLSGRKIRQYPKYYGTSTACYSTRNDEIDLLTGSILEKIDMVGFCGLEYKYDRIRGRYYIMEPTIGRFDSQIALSYAAGVNLPVLMYEIMNGNDNPVCNGQKNNIYWIDEFRDIKARKVHYNGIKENRKQEKSIRVFFDIHDLLPFYKFYDGKAKFIKNGIRFCSKLPSRFRRALLQKYAGSITGVHTSDKVVALTFDDGPHPEYTPRLVDVLNKYNAKATFFMVGESAERYPEIVKYIASSGHVIANHTWNHPAVPAINRKERRQQILNCEKTLSPYGSKYFRPPYGFQSFNSYFDAKSLGYNIVGWTKAVEDWLDHDAEYLAEDITKALRPGNIILMHDVLYHTIKEQYSDRTPLINALDNVLKNQMNQYSFVTVPELLSYGKPKKEAWYRKPDIAWLNALNNGQARQYT